MYVVQREAWIKCEYAITYELMKNDRFIPVRGALWFLDDMVIYSVLKIFW